MDDLIEDVTDLATDQSPDAQPIDSDHFTSMLLYSLISAPMSEGETPLFI